MKHLFLIFITVLVFNSNGIAQETMEPAAGSSDMKWHFLIEPYLMLPNMSGTSGLGALPEISVDANPGDIFKRLQMAAMLNTEVYNDKWSIGSDFIYMHLKQDVEPNLLIVKGNIRAKQFAWNISGLYHVMPWLDLGVGGNLNSIKLKTDIGVKNLQQGINQRTREISQTWFDPMIIARTASKRGEKFIYQVRVDVGGFGIGSKFAYQAQAYAGYRFSELFQLTGGYRVIGANYENSSSSEGILNNDGFLYDMTTFGPVIKFGFNL